MTEPNVPCNNLLTLHSQSCTGELLRRAGCLRRYTRIRAFIVCRHIWGKPPFS
jgi:hypothetical protein